ncbi:MAG: crossover junction endodeoxyribonuclease RuvC [Candidatus Gastranaerophilales bacterium]|nr:crossover junction endodeoxyribonuclease RuvC [Candidatus Gastranaerophilales bacterium]
MKILGIDPGMAIIGYSIIEFNDDELLLLNSGSIKTSKTRSDSQRLLEIFEDITIIIEKYQPDIASVEKLFFFKNQKTVMSVAAARGVIMMALEKCGVPTFEYTPMEVKQTLTGYGRSDKKEVEQMVKIALDCHQLPCLDDTVDAMAIAICHTRSVNVLEKETVDRGKKVRCLEAWNKILK